jgi:hypothetical protein
MPWNNNKKASKIYLFHGIKIKNIKKIHFYVEISIELKF